MMVPMKILVADYQLRYLPADGTRAHHIRKALDRYIGRLRAGTLPRPPCEPAPTNALHDMATDAAARLNWALSQCRDEQERAEVRSVFDGWKPA